MKADFLTAFGLNTEEVKKILDKVSEEIAEATKALITQNEELTKQINTANDTIKGFEGVNVEELNKKISDYETKLKTTKEAAEQKLKSLVLDNAINGKLSNVPEKYRKLIASQIDREKLTVKDNEVLGLEEQYTRLREDYSNLFEDNSKGISFGFNGGSGTGNTTPSTNNTLASIFGVKAD